MKLYELNEAFINVRQMFEDGDIDQQAFTDTIKQIDLDIEEKIKNCVIMMREHDRNIETLKAEIDRLDKLVKSEAGAADWLEGYIYKSMVVTGKDKIDLGLFKLTLKAATQKTKILDESKIPSEFFVTIPESKQLDKRALLAALKLGEIAGAELEDGKRALTIK
ncbi:MAG: siphovirus Gp157 family protein [Cellvibrio sp.]|nr:siphovirus Gp157 family protein [Cellvibrio sp.]